MKKSLLLLFSALFSVLMLPSSVVQATPQSNRYEELLSLLRAAAPMQDDMPDESRSNNVIGDTSFGVLTLSKQAALENGLTLMASNDAFPSLPSDVLFNKEAWESLHLLTGSPSVLDTLGHTRTLFGRLFLAKMLTSPTTDQTRIHKRQELIRTLLVTHSLTNDVAHKLTRIAHLEDHLLSLGDKNHPLYDDDMQLYHEKWLIRKISPDNRTWQSMAKLIGDIWFLAGPVGMGASIYGIATLIHRTGRHTLEKAHGRKNARYSLSERYDAGIKELQRRSGRGSNGRNVMSESAIHAAILGTLAYLTFTAVNTLPWGIRRAQALHYMYHQIKPLTEFFQILSDLRVLTHRLPALQALNDEIDFNIIEDDPDVAKLKKILSGPAFKSAATAQLFGGDIVMAVELLKKCRTKIFKGIGLLGAFDAYTGLASWYQASKHKEALPVCFASFSTTKKPFLALKDFWHPSLTPENGITNSLNLGGPTATNNAIITGLFESGKSMLLHSAALNILCAQTIGLCPARSYHCSPFAAINIYASIKDDLANDRSLFRTELYRALQLLDHIQQLPAGSFSFSVADATFTGTEAGAGQAAAYAVARYLGRLNNSIAIHATNFLSMSMLGVQQPDRFTNYFLPSSFNGTAEHSYALTPGTQEPRLATAIFKEEELPRDMVTLMEKHLYESTIGGVS